MDKQVKPTDFALNETFDLITTHQGEFRLVKYSPIGADPDHAEGATFRREEKVILTHPDGRWAETWVIVE